MSDQLRNLDTWNDSQNDGGPDPDPCLTCNGRGGTLTTEYQGEPPHGGLVDWLNDCPDCLGAGKCPGCLAVLPLTFAVFDDNCPACGWYYDPERFYVSDVEDYGYDDDPANDLPF